MIRPCTAFVALLALAAPALAKDLPQCDSMDAKKIFVDTVKSRELLEIKGREGDDGKRWCYAYYIGGPNLGGTYMEAVYTLEWVNEAEGRFWLQIRQTTRSCRGVSGDPWSRERCAYKQQD